MIKTILTLGVLLSIGCAHNEARVSDVAAVQSQPYTQGLVGLPLRSLDPAAKSLCARAQNLAGVSWQRQMNIANACVRAANPNLLELVGQNLAQSEHLGPWGAYYLSVAAELRKDDARAMWMIELALKKAPNSGLLVYQQARLSWKLKDQTAATKGFARALALDSRLTDAHVILGQLSLDDGKLSEASTHFQQALAVDPRQTSALAGMGEVRIRSNDGKGASEWLAQLALLTPTSYRTLIRQAFVFETLEKNPMEALVTYRRIKILEREHRLDGSIDVDLDAKIRALEVAVKGITPNAVTLRDAASEKKVEK